MILSASRRTDIPALYFDWFLNRLKEGFVLVPNPHNKARISRIELSPANTDCIVFWTKNPGPMLERLTQFEYLGYEYYVQFTLTPYGKDIERGLPPKEDLLQAFTTMSKRIATNRAVWRYDPILIDTEHSLDWHAKQFTNMCEKLCNYTTRCILSFIDTDNIRNMFRTMTHDEMNEIAERFSKIAKQCGIKLFTCAEEIDLAKYEIEHASCIDQNLIEEIIGQRITAKKDPYQRPACRCIESIDIGVYDTCPNGCDYCYATLSLKKAQERIAAHDPATPMLTGFPTGDEIINPRIVRSQKVPQISLF